jgi:DNA-directed RNA polymerase subunit RPC12/RpoP
MSDMAEQKCPKCGAALKVPAAEDKPKLVRADCSACGAVVAVRLLPKSEQASPPSADERPAIPALPRGVMATQAAEMDEPSKSGGRPLWLAAIVGVGFLLIALYVASRCGEEPRPPAAGAASQDEDARRTE